MKIAEFRDSIQKYNQEHPELNNCIYPNCPNKIDPQWDNDVVCEEHSLMFIYWFYEESGYRFCPEVFDMSGIKLPKPKGSDADMTAYRKRYCDWIASLSESEYINILKNQIGDRRRGVE